MTAARVAKRLSVGDRPDRESRSHDRRRGRTQRTVGSTRKRKRRGPTRCRGLPMHRWPRCRQTRSPSSAHRETAHGCAEKRVPTSKRVRTRAIARKPERSSGRSARGRSLHALATALAGRPQKEIALLDAVRCRVAAVVAAVLHIHAHTSTAALVSRRAVDCATQRSRSLQGGSQCPS